GPEGGTGIGGAGFTETWSLCGKSRSTVAAATSGRADSRRSIAVWSRPTRLRPSNGARASRTCDATPGGAPVIRTDCNANSEVSRAPKYASTPAARSANPSASARPEGSFFVRFPTGRPRGRGSAAARVRPLLETDAIEPRFAASGPAPTAEGGALALPSDCTPPSSVLAALQVHARVPPPWEGLLPTSLCHRA